MAVNEEEDRDEFDGNPFNIPMVFFRVGWMNQYQGVTANDGIVGGGSYVDTHGFGFEAFNYKPFEGNVYGWVMTGNASKKRQGSLNLQPSSNEEFAKINLNRIGALSTDESISGVTVVWVSTSPEGGAFVVGWYQNATVFMQQQEAPFGSGREHDGLTIGYMTTTKATDAVLIPNDERVIQVPQGGKGSFGQSNIWYADDPTNEIQRELRQAVLDAIQDQALPRRKRLSPRTPPRQYDVLIRQRVEQIAIETVSKYFIAFGYEVSSVERDNVGWDLEAVLDKRKLYLEVKGLSGNEISVELTPNEYAKMNEHRKNFRLCTVTSALNDPSLFIFQYNAESGHWESGEGGMLSINEVVSARCTASPLKVK
jgi:hypothetical protein